MAEESSGVAVTGPGAEEQHFPLLKYMDLPEMLVNPTQSTHIDIVAIESGWLLYSCPTRVEPRRFLWVPPHRREHRPGRIVSAGSTTVLMGQDRVITILDTSGLAQSLNK
jgi:hypothetical protein